MTAIRKAGATLLMWLLEAIGALAVFELVLAPVLTLALDPRRRMLALAVGAPLLLAPLVVAAAWLSSFGATLGEWRDLARDRATRVAHGLEHAAAKLLAADFQVVYGGRTYVGGRPDCGTSQIAMQFLLALVVLGSAAIGLGTHVAPRALLAIVAIGAVVLLAGARPLGLAAQRLLTVSAVFRSARVRRVGWCVVHGGDRARFTVHLDVRLGQSTRTSKAAVSTRPAALTWTNRR